MHRWAKALLGVILLIAAALSQGCTLYFARGSSGGSVLWNADEAYLFIGVNRQGHHVNRLRYPWFTAKEYLGAVEEPDDDSTFLVVIRVTSAGVERHELKLPDTPDSGPTQYTPLDGRIYAKCPTLGICRWAGDHFEATTVAERRRFDAVIGINAAARPSQDGWSKREFGTGPQEASFTINVGDKFELSFTNTPVKGTGYGAISIDLMQRGRPPERIWTLDGRPRSVSSAEYQEAFPRRK